MKHLSIGSEWINAILRAFANSGLDINAITHELPGFDHTQFQSGQRLELSAARQMWHRAAQLSQDPLLGVKIGLSQDYRAVGVLAPVLWHSPTVREALNNIVRFQKLISESGVYHASEHHDENMSVNAAPNSSANSSVTSGTNSAAHYIDYEYVPAANIVPVNPHQVLAVVTGTLGIIAGISNLQVLPLQLQVPNTLNTKVIAKQLGCEVITSSSNLILRFPCEHIDDELEGRDPHLYEINKAYAEQLLRSKNEGEVLIDTVKNIIAKCGYGASSMDDVQASLGIHKRALQRHLSEQGTSFRLLKEEVLKEQCVKKLMLEKQDIESIAQTLGYSEPSAFHRAFKAWFGVTPKQFSNPDQTK